MIPNKSTPQGATPAPQSANTASTYPTPCKLLRLPAVEQLTGLKKSTIYAGMNAVPRTFPAPVRLSTRAVAWRESDIADWQASRQQSRDQ
jgi:prophage regulatory protein